MRTKLLCVIALVLSGCASVQRGTTDRVTFDSEPSGAAMTSIVKSPCGGPCQSDMARNGPSGRPYLAQGEVLPTEVGPNCTTPCTLELLRAKDYIVTFAKPGYQPQTVELLATLGEGAGATAGNIMVGGLTGVMIDASTKAAYDHQPNPMKAVLKPLR